MENFFIALTPCHLDGPRILKLNFYTEYLRNYFSVMSTFIKVVSNQHNDSQHNNRNETIIITTTGNTNDGSITV